MTRLLISLLAAAGIAFAGAASAATTMSRDEYGAQKKQIDVQYKADRDHCAALAGNAKDVCQVEAKGKEKVAKAELEADYRNTANARYDARVAKADADFGGAKEKCHDLSGNRKDACVKEAKPAPIRAKAEARVAQTDSKASAQAASKRADARSEARDDMRDAQYKVALEKCDALSGGAKDQCVKDAKSHFGKS